MDKSLLGSVGSRAIPSQSKFDRRLFLKGTAGVAAGVVTSGAGIVLFPSITLGAATPSSLEPNRMVSTTAAPLPKALRSRAALDRTVGTVSSVTLPITQNGTTYEMAQEVRWLDANHFAVGRWDGSMSIFSFETAAYEGPLISKAVNAPAFQGVEMVTALPNAAMVTSNDATSLALW